MPIPSCVSIIQWLAHGLRKSIYHVLQRYKLLLQQQSEIRRLDDDSVVAGQLVGWTLIITDNHIPTISSDNLLQCSVQGTCGDDPEYAPEPDFETHNAHMRYLYRFINHDIRRLAALVNQKRMKLNSIFDDIINVSILAVDRDDVLSHLVFMRANTIIVQWLAKGIGESVGYVFDNYILSLSDCTNTKTSTIIARPAEFHAIDAEGFTLVTFQHGSHTYIKQISLKCMLVTF